MTVIDIAAAFLLSLSFTAIYHKYCVPKHMIMLYGRENSLLLKKKMDQRKDKYCIERMIYCDDYTFEEIITEFEERQKRIYSGRADRCTGNPGNPGSTADPGTDRLH